jgi:hypothetical protein
VSPKLGETMPVEQRRKIAAANTKHPKYKVCGKCGRRRRASSFGLRPNGHTLASYCKTCIKSYNAAKSRKHWASMTPAQRAAAHRSNRSFRLNQKYGLNADAYAAQLALQGGVCAICGSSDPGKGRRYFSVDHDHETGAVRGLLCAPCNRGLGLLCDDLSTVEAAARYLRWHLTSQPRAGAA